MKFLKLLGNGFIEANKDFWRDMKATWKQALFTYILLISISYFTNTKMDVVIQWFVLSCILLAVFAIIYCFVMHFLNKKNKTKKDT